MKKFLSAVIAAVCVFQIPLCSLAYNRDHARSYAFMYTPTREQDSNHRKDYYYNKRYFPAMSGDCTNFASQCLNRGGIAMKEIPDSKVGYSDLGEAFHTKDYWSCKKYTKTLKVAGINIKKSTDFVWSSTWSCVDRTKDGTKTSWGLYQWMTNHGGEAKSYEVNTDVKRRRFVRDCRVGDIVMIKTKNGKHWHTMICTGKDKDDVYFTYHTDNHFNESFNNYLMKPRTKGGAELDGNVFTIINPDRM